MVQHAKKYRNAAILIELGLVLIFILDFYLNKTVKIINFLFRLNGEFNIPALFSAIQLFLVGYGFLFFYNQKKNNQLPSSRIYRFLGIVFIYLALDEGLVLHESLSMLFRNVDWVPKMKGGHGVWILPYVVICFAIFLFNFKAFSRMWREHHNETKIMASGFLIYLLGALVIEVSKAVNFIWKTTPENHFSYDNPILLQVVSEEFLEMFGITIVLYGLLLLHQQVNMKGNIKKYDLIEKELGTN
jgi:hypothetical protein